MMKYEIKKNNGQFRGENEIVETTHYSSEIRSQKY